MATGRRAKSNAGKSPDAISELTTARLSVYLRCLTNLEAMGVTTVSSHDLATRFHLNSAQIRKDLAYFGDFGIRGVGYDVALLRQNLIRALGLDQPRAIVIAGAGNLGMALVNWLLFSVVGGAAFAWLIAAVDRWRGVLHTAGRHAGPGRAEILLYLSELSLS